MTLETKPNQKPHKIEALITPDIFEDLDIRKKDMSSDR